MTLTQAIEKIEQHANNPHLGLPQEVFELISRLTPLVNIDLLIKDKANRALLAWRQDQFAGPGWHIPGGIVRYKESLQQRIEQVAQIEIGQNIDFNPAPIAINEIHRLHATRGHFISFLYNCTITQPFIPNNVGLTNTDPGYLVWHESCPDNLIEVHELYRDYIENEPVYIP